LDPLNLVGGGNIGPLLSDGSVGCGGGVDSCEEHPAPSFDVDVGAGGGGGGAELL